MRDEATQRQVAAADPAASTWVTANAGSGKTRVLTDRVARLLLQGCSPQRILCLTYTRAAAAEMQNRLFRRLGAWAMLPDDALRGELAQLGAAEVPDAAALAAARRLFAQAIETPGGLRIQTIHSFCAALLRRFPLEAGVSPRFQEADDRAAELLRADLVERLAEAQPDLVAGVARHHSGEDFGALATRIAGARAAFDPRADAGAIRAALGLPEGLTAAGLVAQVRGLDGAEAIAAVLPALAASGPNDAKAAQKLAALREPWDLAALVALEGVLLYASGEKANLAKVGALPTKAVRAALGPALAPFEALMGRVEAARPLRLALMAAERAEALHAFAAAFLDAYAAAKAARGWLDFDDLIARARALMADPGVAQWVLWRLDGGIDHILIDEAQDTGPAQWKVIEGLAQEILAGEGARGPGRTVFVVGDRKQSIYSFQGADLAAFEAMQARFAAQLAHGRGLQRVELEHSFRSSPAVLAAVDATFAAAGPAGVGGAVRHRAFLAERPGRVDLWPAVVRDDAPEAAAWFDPVDLSRPADPAVRLAETIADTIAGWLAAGTQVPTRDGTRPMRAGDVLILVRRRSALFAEIIRACKARGLPMAGADRLKLGAELAVKDIAALLAFLDTPDDDLSLAAALRSPLFGWTEGDLYDLAQPRPEGATLWQALRAGADRWAETLAVLRDLRDSADFLRPYDLIERILTRHDGRRRLIARLGPEAEDGIDQLLAQALAFEAAEVPGLTAFLVWLTTDDIEARRQVDAASDRIRVMTVHGAKGLESPVVILPDCADPHRRDRDEIVTLEDGLPVWHPAGEEPPPAVAAARAARAKAAAEEDRRLLYVAMTRAESWLVVAAAGKAERPESWHAMVAAGLQAAGAGAWDQPTGQGLRLATGDWPAPRRPAAAPEPPPAAVADPGPPPAAAAPMRPRSPSDLGGEKALPGEGGDAEAAKRRGTLLHRLFEALPTADPADWPAIAAALDPEGSAGALLDEARRALADPALAEVFAPDALVEAAVSATIGGVRWFGTVDRLILRPGRALAVDFKTNRLIPPAPEAVPEGILRQMGAYRAMLAAAFPGRAIDCAVLWTAGPRLMPLSDPLLRAAFLRAGAA